MPDLMHVILLLHYAMPGLMHAFVLLAMVAFLSSQDFGNRNLFGVYWNSFGVCCNLEAVETLLYFSLPHASSPFHMLLNIFIPSQVDALSEFSVPPRLAIDMERLLPEPLRLQIDQYVKNRTPPTLPKVSY
jgi:hypothetical protein